MHMIGQGQMAQYMTCPSYRAMRPNRRASRDSGAASHGGMLADSHIVGNLHQVIKLDAVFQHSVLQCAPVNAGVGADFNIIADPHRTELLDLDPSASMRRKAETVSANDRARMNDAALAHPAAISHRDTRRQAAVGANHRLLSYHAMLRNARTLANCRACGNAGKRANGNTCCQRGTGVNMGLGMNVRCRLRKVMPFPELRNQREAVIRILRDDARAAAHGNLAGIRRNHHTGRNRLRKPAQELRLAEETQVMWPGRIQGGQPFYQQIRIAMQLDIDRTSQETDNI